MQSMWCGMVAVLRACMDRAAPGSRFPVPTAEDFDVVLAEPLCQPGQDRDDRASGNPPRQIDTGVARNAGITPGCMVVLRLAVRSGRLTA